MRQSFRTQQIRPERSARIDEANEILDDYSAQGYRLTLRQLYYQLVARGSIPNDVREYAKLSSTMVIARMNGLTDWYAIEDRIRKPYILYSVVDIAEALEDVVDDYRLNRQNGQAVQVEVWTEKDAVSNILKRVTQYYHVKLMVNRGYSSCSAMYNASQRFIYRDSPNARTALLYVGDHDPSGLDMLRDIRERLEEFGVDQFKVVPVALTREQIEEFNPPPNPAKISDPRASWYIHEHGEESWELDALPPEVLENLVREAVKEEINEELFEKVLAKENEDKEALREIIEKFKEEEDEI